ncbi:hypothetical protein BEL04_15995 [Mucilaginibacter sp. PPCGB 2223]|uniref:gliding motility-associated C-terminal domain-containing protein n=1 Tax=Mucilaginibacter sp. PPCGB 2223 TaxID=1886027 RepID=UPI0008269D3B|nr:gliding motility-associated C-terminal domain-containing protein [Mucilaginibacter sp. PPCGB 2223]OCX51525.1 hypothetical protein BEL04_15995 [Mucilaginibacter sp. PPCGB 2223]
MKKICLIVTFLLLSVFACGQSFYVVTSDGYLKKVSLGPAGATSTDISTCNSALAFGSIALFKNTIYQANGLQILQGTLTPNSVANCSAIPAVALPLGNALTVDSTGVLYMDSGTDIYKIDPKNPVLTHLGQIPFISGGDLVFYKGDLYLASTVGIVRIDQVNTANSTLHIPISRNIYGLVSIAYSSTHNKVYALAVSGNSTDLLELDMENKTVVGTTATLPYVVYDAASDVESGEIPKIVIDSVRQIVTCPYHGKVGLQVVCQNPLADYQYILNDAIINTTGIFQVAPGTYDLKVKSTTQTKDTTIIVTAQDFAKPVITINKTDENCDQKGQIGFNIGNANQYTIQDASGTYPADHVFTGLTAGSYSFYVLNHLGCTVDTITVTVNRVKCAINITAATTTKNCAALHAGDIQVTAASHATASNTYTLNGITNTTGIFTAINPGSYTLHIATSEGVTKDTTLIIPDFYLRKPTVTYTKTDFICDVPGSITITARLADSTYRIQSGSSLFASGHKFTEPAAGNYFFSVVDSRGCLMDTLSVNINFIKCDPVVFPNTFTPNKDGINDIFLPMQGGVATKFKFSVFDRFGALLFSSTDLHTGWDGTYKGAPAPLGTYYWIATYYDQNNLYRTQSGSVLLVR